MRKIIASLLVLGLVFVGINAVGLAHGGPGGYNKGNFQGQKPYYNRNVQTYDDNPLDLTEEQQEKLENIQEKFFEDRDELVTSLREKRFELREKSFNGTDQAEISKLENEIADLQQQLTALQTERWNSLKEVLTEEQIEKMQEVQAEYGYGPGSAMRGYGTGNMHRGYGMHGYGMHGGFSRMNGGFQGRNFGPRSGFGGCPWF